MPPSKPTASRPAVRQSGALGHKQLDSEAISEHLNRFLHDGGHIEKLGTTRVLTRIDGTQAPAKPRR